MATLAHRFFGLIHDAETAKLINQPADAGKAGAWPLAYFTLYLQKRGITVGDATALARILNEMERTGLLMRAGWWANPAMLGVPMQGQLYVSQGVVSAQTAGHLWLSEVLGFELVIESYKAATFLISGGEGKPVGTALVLDRTHMVTNRHVIEGLVGPSAFDARSPGPTVFDEAIEVHPSYKPPNAEPASRPARIIAHRDIDVAVVEVQFGENEHLPAVPGMAFREPKWYDDVCVFGYPYVPGLTERPITVERGQIVNPATEAAGLGGYPRQPTFLTSAIARPGNSGGPIVANDGRVIGLVVENARYGLTSASAGVAPANEPDHVGSQGETGQNSADADSPPFYRGIPGSQVVRAINELGFEGCVVLE
ncbi:trypsin family protein [Mycobacterium intracellulare MIN_061107_1834]|nr:trypsin family protein [Mycobacterium intracellulare MIN_061107_1834]